MPSLQHLAFMNYLGFFNERAKSVEFFMLIIPRLVSFTTVLSNALHLPPIFYTLPSLSLLFRTTSGQEAPTALYSVRNLYISLPNECYQYHVSHSRNRDNLQDWRNLILNSNHNLETIYLAITSGGGGGLVPREIYDSVVTLAAACRNRNVEVYWEEDDQGSWERDRFDALVPKSFITKAKSRWIG
jgi:hypothetical protein